jgi:uncharacterized protein YjiS (DUF1127 family)
MPGGARLLYKSSPCTLMLHRVRPDDPFGIARRDSPRTGKNKDHIRSITMIPFKTITEKLNAWRRYREAVKELSQLSDRELSDIGIRRGDIEFIVRQGFATA